MFLSHLVNIVFLKDSEYKYFAYLASVSSVSPLSPQGAEYILFQVIPPN